MAQEVLGRRVLVEPADQVRDGAVEVLGPDDRRVEQETPARARTARTWWLAMPSSISNSTHGVDAVGGAQHEPVGEVEEVVAGDPQLHGLGVLGRQPYSTMRL